MTLKFCVYHGLCEGDWCPTVGSKPPSWLSLLVITIDLSCTRKTPTWAVKVTSNFWCCRDKYIPCHIGQGLAGCIGNLRIHQSAGTAIDLILVRNNEPGKIASILWTNPHLMHIFILHKWNPLWSNQCPLYPPSLLKMCYFVYYCMCTASKTIIMYNQRQHLNLLIHTFPVVLCSRIVWKTAIQIQWMILMI